MRQHLHLRVLRHCMPTFTSEVGISAIYSASQGTLLQTWEHGHADGILDRVLRLSIIVTLNTVLFFLLFSAAHRKLAHPFVHLLLLT